jgi:hypothetical protein
MQCLGFFSLLLKLDGRNLVRFLLCIIKAYSLYQNRRKRNTMFCLRSLIFQFQISKVSTHVLAFPLSSSHWTVKILSNIQCNLNVSKAP